ncbi:MAG: hypothetical protein PHF63_06375 [Herbinix sp.]|nr:hypothetical protein [Herbinix sp.]
MNNSKKLKQKKVKKEKLSEKPITSVSKPWLITSIVLVVILIGALLFDQLYEATLMKIDDKKYQMNDLSYYFNTVETSYDSYSQIFGGSVWNMTYDEKAGTTFSDVARDEAVNQSLYYEILNNEALNQGYTLTEEEKTTVSTNVDSLLKEQYSAAVIKKNHFTKAYLTDILNKTTLVERFRQDKIDALDIDDAAIKAGISVEDYRQYDIEYIKISTQTTDEDGNTVDLSDTEKTAAYDKISAIYDKTKTTKDWSTLIPTDETDLIYKEDSFITTDTTFSDDFKKMMMAMENSSISEIYKDTTGYYIVRMVNNNSSESYDSAVEKAITDAENTAFDDVYAKIKANHTYKLNEGAIKSLKMGTLTLAD